MATVGVSGAAGDWRVLKLLSERRLGCYADSSEAEFRIWNHAGGVPEWFKGAVLKTAVARATVGSNPTPSSISRTCLEDKSARCVNAVYRRPVPYRRVW